MTESMYVRTFSPKHVFFSRVLSAPTCYTNRHSDYFRLLDLHLYCCTFLRFDLP